MITPSAELIRHAEALAKQLSAFKSPGSNNPVDVSLVASVQRYVLTRPSRKDLKAFLAAYPSSSWAQYTRSSGPQVSHLCRMLRPLIANLEREVEPGDYNDALAYILGVSQRLRRAEQLCAARPERRGDERHSGTRKRGGGRW